MPHKCATFYFRSFFDDQNRGKGGWGLKKWPQFQSMGDVTSTPTHGQFLTLFDQSTLDKNMGWVGNPEVCRTMIALGSEIVAKLIYTGILKKSIFPWRDASREV